MGGLALSIISSSPLHLSTSSKLNFFHPNSLVFCKTTKHSFSPHSTQNATMRSIMVLSAFAGILSSAAGQYIAIAATHFGSSIRLQPITASGHRLTIGTATASYCPSEIEQEVGCPDGTSTNFEFGGGGLFMGAVVPGDQPNPQTNFHVGSTLNDLPQANKSTSTPNAAP